MFSISFFPFLQSKRSFNTSPPFNYLTLSPQRYPLATLRRLVLLKLEILPSRAARSLVDFGALFATSTGGGGMCDGGGGGGGGMVPLTGAPSPCGTWTEP